MLSSPNFSASVRSISFHNFVFNFTNAGHGQSLYLYWRWFQFQPSQQNNGIVFENITMVEMDKIPANYQVYAFFVVSQQLSLINVDIVKQPKISSASIFYVTGFSYPGASYAPTNIVIDRLNYLHNSNSLSNIMQTPNTGLAVGKLTISNSHFMFNQNVNALFNIYTLGVTAGTFVMTDSVFLNNTFYLLNANTGYASPPPAMYLNYFSSFLMQNCLFINNIAQALSPSGSYWCGSGSVIALGWPNFQNVPLQAHNNSFLNNWCIDKKQTGRNASIPLSYPLNFSPYKFDGSSNLVLPQPQCPPGAEWDALSCEGCPIGYFSNTTGLVCDPCPAGSYINSIGATTCTLCKAGSSSQPGKNSCSPCPAGTFAGADGSPECYPCPVGYYQSSTGSSYCLTCGPGTCAPSPGSTKCTTEC
jgi:hypothetical protein